MNKGELKLFPIRFPSSSFSLIRQLIFGKSQVITRHPALIFPRTPGSLCSTVVRQLFDPCQTAVRRGSNSCLTRVEHKLYPDFGKITSDSTRFFPEPEKN